MDSLSICWRGMAGVGKRTQLQTQLKALAARRGVPYTVQIKSLAGSGGGVSEEGDEGAVDTQGEDVTATGQLMYESSLVHTGLDIARMSMQDKQVLRPILNNMGQGSHVLAGAGGHGARILVLYHAHLLSSESVLLLQACLEQNEGDISIWLTSELPVPQRIRDWFVEVPVVGSDLAFQIFQRGLEGSSANWIDVFGGLLTKWVTSPYPVIHDIKEVKAFVYELLMRNLRWVEATHFLLDVLLVHPELTVIQRADCIKALAECEATAGGYTIPSYRIPILWESLFLKLRTILYKPVVGRGQNDSIGSGRVKKTGGARNRKSATKVE